MATKSSQNADEITCEQENGIRLRLLLEKMEKALCCQLRTKFTIDDPSQFYKELDDLRPKLQELQKQKRICKEQFELLLPSCGKSNAEKMDISLIMQLLYGFCGFNRAAKTETEKNIAIIKKKRDFIQHGPLSRTDQEFNAIYISVKQPLIDLGCTKEEVETIKKIKLIDFQSKEKIKKLDKSSTGPFNYKYIPPVSNFIGREVEVQEIHQKLVQYNDNVDFLNPVYGLVISGMSGVGKTEIVRKYWLKYGQTYYENSIVWINANSKQLIENSFFEVAEQAGLSIKNQDGNYELISKVISKVYCHFTLRKSDEPQRRVLFVFDNLNDPAKIQDYLPPTIHYSPYILVTSQSKSWDTRFKVYDLKVLPEDTAHSFFQENLVSNEKDNNDDISALLSEIEHHPLAMQQSVAYINTNEITINDYIDLLKERGKDLLMNDTVYSFNCQSVYKTICLSLESLAERNDEAAETLLNTMAYLDGKNIKKGFLLKFCNEDKILLNRSLALLKNLSLINVHNSKETVEFDEQVITIHALVKKVLKQENAGQRDAILNFIFDIMFESLQNAITSNKVCNAGKHWFNHFMYIYSKDDTRNDLVTRSLPIQNNIFVMFKAKGNLQTLCFLHSIERYYLTRRFSNDSIEMITTQCQIAATLVNIQKPKEGLELSKKIEQTLLKVLGQEHPYMLATQATIGYAFLYLGKYQECLTVFKKLEEKRLDPDLLKIQSIIATAFFKLGKYHECMELVDKVAERQVKIFGPEHPEVLTSYKLLAYALSKTDKTQEALKLHKKIEEIELNVLGAEHPDLLTTQHEIALLILELGNYQDSLKQFKKIQDTTLKLFGPEHPDLLRSQNSIAYVLLKTGKHQEALKQFRMVQEKLPQESPHLILVQQNIAQTLLEIGEHNEALKVFKIVEERQLKILGPDHPDILTTQSNIAVTLIQAWCYTALHFFAKYLSCYFFCFVYIFSIFAFSPLTFKNVAPCLS